MSPFRVQIIFLAIRSIFCEFSGDFPSNSCLRKILETHIKPNETILTVNHRDFSLIKTYVTINYRLNATEIKSQRYRYSHNRFFLLSIPPRPKSLFDFLIYTNQINPNAVYILTSTTETIDYESILFYLKLHYIDKLAIIAGNDLYSYERSIFRLYSNCSNLPKLFRGFYDRQKIDNVSILTYEYVPFTLRHSRNGLMDIITDELMASMSVKYQFTYTEGNVDNVWQYFLEGFHTNSESGEDVMGAAAIPVPWLVGYLEMTGWTVADCSYFAVPFEIEHKHRLNMTAVFDRYVWTLLAGCLVLIGAVYYKIRRSLDGGYGKIDSVFDVVRFQMDNPAAGKSINRRASIRICVGLLLLSSMVFNGLFKGKLFNSRVTEKSRQLYDSVEDIANKGLKIGMHDMAIKALINSTNAYESFIARQAKSCPIDETCLNRTAFGRDLATVKFDCTVRYLLPKYYVDRLGRPLVHLIKSYRLLCTAFPFYFRRGHPLFGRFNVQLGRFQQHGLVQKIVRDFKTNTNVAWARAHLRGREFKFAAVSLAELRAVFLIYFVCNLVALVAFGLELARVFG